MLVVVAAIAWAPATRAGSFEDGMTAFRASRLEDAVPLFEAAVREAPQNPDRHAWLAETLRRLDRLNDAELEARAALARAPCHAFAHAVIGDIYNPQYSTRWERANEDTAWVHVQRAVACDSTDGNAWLGAYFSSLQHGDSTLARRAMRGMIDTGILTPATLALARWMLDGLPKGALLLTNGDFDTYPLLAVQEAEGLRPDVAVVNIPMLSLGWYARRTRDRWQLPLPDADGDLDSLQATYDPDGQVVTLSERIVRSWLASAVTGRLARPLAAAVTVSGLDFTPDSRRHFQLAGGHWVCLPDSNVAPVDTRRTRESLLALRGRDFRGAGASPKDRSPIRNPGGEAAGGNPLRSNVFIVAGRYLQAVDGEGDRSALAGGIDWMIRFDKESGARWPNMDRVKAMRPPVSAGGSR